AVVVPAPQQRRAFAGQLVCGVRGHPVVHDAQVPGRTHAALRPPQRRPLAAVLRPDGRLPLALAHPPSLWRPHTALPRAYDAGALRRRRAGGVRTAPMLATTTRAIATSSGGCRRCPSTRKPADAAATGIRLISSA